MWKFKFLFSSRNFWARLSNLTNSCGFFFGSYVQKIYVWNKIYASGIYYHILKMAIFRYIAEKVFQLLIISNFENVAGHSFTYSLKLNLVTRKFYLFYNHIQINLTTKIANIKSYTRINIGIDHIICITENSPPHLPHRV